MLSVSAMAFVIYFVSRNAGNPYDQYVRLADAVLHGRLHLLNPPSYLELAHIHGKWFVIDPPAPILFLLPLVAILGTGTNHVLVSCGVGALAIGFLWVSASRLWPNRSNAVAITLLVAVGTDFWWIASDGGFWSFAHVSAVFFLMAGMAEATGRKRPWLVGSCVGLAGLSRLPTFLLFPLYAYLTLEDEPSFTRQNVLRLVAFGSTLGAAAISYLGYNWIRYGTPRDLGYWNPKYMSEPWFAQGRFNIRYVSRHIHAILFEWPARVQHFPYVVPKFVGTALILVTPMFLYALRAKLGGREVAALIALGLVSVPLLTHGAVGFSQFGYRFSLDMLPPLLILTASGMRGRVSKLAVAVLVYCVVVNLWGVLAFNKFNWPV